MNLLENTFYGIDKSLEDKLNSIGVRNKRLFSRKKYRKFSSVMNDIAKKWSSLSADDRDKISKKFGMKP